MRWLAISVLVGLTVSLTGQTSIYGVDRNPSAQMFAEGKPELGHSVKLSWGFDNFEMGVRVLVLGTDTEVEANVCYHSSVRGHEEDRWLLVAPFWHIPIWNLGPSNEFGFAIPENAALVGLAVRAQIWVSTLPGSGPQDPCAKLRATPAVRIQFMPH